MGKSQVVQNNIGRGPNFCLQKFLTGLAGLVYFIVVYQIIWCTHAYGGQEEPTGVHPFSVNQWIDASLFCNM